MQVALCGIVMQQANALTRLCVRCCSQAGLYVMFDLVASHDARIPAAMRLLHMPQPYSLNTFLTRGVQYSSAAANPK